MSAIYLSSMIVTFYNPSMYFSASEICMDISLDLWHLAN